AMPAPGTPWRTMASSRSGEAARTPSAGRPSGSGAGRLGAGSTRRVGMVRGRAALAGAPGQDTYNARAPQEPAPVRLGVVAEHELGGGRGEIDLFGDAGDAEPAHVVVDERDGHDEGHEAAPEGLDQPEQLAPVVGAEAVREDAQDVPEHVDVLARRGGGGWGPHEGGGGIRRARRPGRPLRGGHGA